MKCLSVLGTILGDGAVKQKTAHPCSHQTYISWERVLKRNICQVVISTKKKNEQGTWLESEGRERPHLVLGQRGPCEFHMCP